MRKLNKERAKAQRAQRNENRAMARELALKSELKNAKQMSEYLWKHITQLHDVLGEREKDAARYRFLRDTEDSTPELVHAFRMLNDWEAAPEDVDDAVDKAMEASQ